MKFHGHLLIINYYRYPKYNTILFLPSLLEGLLRSFLSNRSMLRERRCFRDLPTFSLVKVPAGDSLEESVLRII